MLCNHNIIIIPNKTNSNALILTSVCSLSHVQLFATPWTVAFQAPLSMGFSRQESWSGVPFLNCRGSSQPRDRTCISCIGRILYHWRHLRSPVLTNTNHIFKFSCPDPNVFIVVFLQARIQLKIDDLLHWVMSLKTLVNQ